MSTSYGTFGVMDAARLAASIANPLYGVASLTTQQIAKPLQASDPGPHQENAMANLAGEILPGMQTLLGGGNADMPKPPPASGFDLQPTDYNSAGNITPYQNSGMSNYLNYMNYRGGY